jgi:hypothetical protein
MLKFAFIVGRLTNSMSLLRRDVANFALCAMNGAPKKNVGEVARREKSRRVFYFRVPYFTVRQQPIRLDMVKSRDAVAARPE